MVTKQTDESMLNDLITNLYYGSKFVSRLIFFILVYFAIYIANFLSSYGQCAKVFGNPWMLF